jgi:nucleoid-associated protein YgaU
MRTDVKVGVAVGLLLVIGVVTYYAIFDRSNQGGANGPAPQVAGKPAAGQVDSAVKKDAPGKSPDVVLPHFGARTTGGPTISVGRAPARPEPAAPVTPAVAALPTIATPTTPPPSSPEPVVTPSVSVRTAPPSTPEPVAAAPSIQDTPSPATPVAAVPAPEPPVTPSMSEPAPVAEPVAPKIRETPIVPAGPSVSPKIRETPGTPVIRETPGGRTGVTPPVPATPGAETVYEVKKGDSGFWAIAEKVYGDGRLYTLLMTANPGVSSDRLQVGMTLKVPPKPATATTHPAGPGPTGASHTGPAIPAGYREHIVKEGDTLTGIAERIYGNGQLYTLIERANPGVSATSLPLGKHLLIPPTPTSGPSPVTHTATTGPARPRSTTPAPTRRPAPTASSEFREPEF